MYTLTLDGLSMLDVGEGRGTVYYICRSGMTDLLFIYALIIYTCIRLSYNLTSFSGSIPTHFGHVAGSCVQSPNVTGLWTCWTSYTLVFSF